MRNLLRSIVSTVVIYCLSLCGDRAGVEEDAEEEEALFWGGTKPFDRKFRPVP